MGGALRDLSRELVSDITLFISVSQSGNDATFTGGVGRCSSTRACTVVVTYPRLLNPHLRSMEGKERVIQSTGPTA